MSPLCAFAGGYVSLACIFFKRSRLAPVALSSSPIPSTFLWLCSPSLNYLQISSPSDSPSPSLLTLLSSSPSSPENSDDRPAIYPFFHFQHCDLLIFHVSGTSSTLWHLQRCFQPNPKLSRLVSGQRLFIFKAQTEAAHLHRPSAGLHKSQPAADQWHWIDFIHPLGCESTRPVGVTF